MIRDFLVESIAQNLLQIELSWAESDAARDRGENWLADEIAKRRRYLDGMNMGFYKAGEQIGFLLGDMSAAATETLNHMRKAREARDPLTVKLDALID